MALHVMLQLVTDPVLALHETQVNQVITVSLIIMRVRVRFMGLVTTVFFLFVFSVLYWKCRPV